MPAPILATKLYIPPPRPDRVPRPQLIARLDEGQYRKLTLISAPAGFGKSTLVSDWVSHAGRPVAWLSLDERDSDPTRFLTYLIAALQTIVDVGETALTALQSSQPPPVESLLKQLLGELDRLPENLFLVLDDYHVIDAKPTNEVLIFLLEHLPPQVHLIIATREDPPLPLARLRARGQMTELRAADLRFRSTEAAGFLTKTMELALTEQEIIALETRTEGWIAGLQMAALSMQGRQAKSAFIDSFTGNHRFILDYLLEEVLQQQTEQVRQFLLQTAVLDRFSPALCNAVTQQENSEQMLLALEQQNLFLVPLDDTRQWYRYHHLFGDVLRSRLQQHGASLAEIHRRTSCWFEENDYPAEAIHHALAANDIDRAARLVEQAWPALQQNTPEHIFLDWITALPLSRVEASPVLSFHYGFALLSSDLGAADAPLNKAQAWLDRLTDEQGRAGAETGGMVVCNEEEFIQLPGLLGIARAYQSGAQGDLPGVVQHAGRALTHLPAGDTLWRGAATALLGLAQWSRGDLEGAYDAIAASAETMRKAGDITASVSALCMLSGVRSSQGRFRDAQKICQKALKIAGTFGDHPPQGTADIYVELAELACETGDLITAEQHLQTSRAMEDYTRLPQIQHRWFIVMARVRKAQGDFDAAEALLDEGAECQIMSPAPETQPVSAWLAHLWLAQGRLDKAREWAEKSGLSPEDETDYLREFQHLTLAGLLIARYREEPDDDIARQTLDLLTRIAKSARIGKRQRSVAQAHLLSALLFDAMGKQQAALKALQQAIDIAEPENYIRLFADEGEPLFMLLRRTRKQIGNHALLDRILSTSAGPEAPATDANSSLAEPLSEREQQVLRLLTSELSGPEIASRLFISLNTLRTHTKKIYSKLGVNSRRTAVHRARELALL